MANPPRDNDRRKCFRFRTSGSRCRAELEFRHRRIPVKLFDESASGFAVVVQKRPDFDRGDVMQLRLESGIFKVAVVYVGETEPTEPWRVGPVFRVGLQRMGNVTMPPDESQTRLSWLAPSGLRAGSRARRALGIVLALAVVVVLVPVMWTGVFRRSALPGSSLLSDRAAGRPVQAGASSQASRPASLANGPQGAHRSSPAAAEWETFARFPGASVFLAPPTIRELGLSGEQQRQIRQIIDQTTETLVQIDARFRGADRQDQARREESVLEDARKLAIDVLTPEQRQRLQSVLTGSQ